MNEFFGDDLPVDLDVTIAGAILADVGKLLEYDIKDGKSCKSEMGKYVRHPFSGVGLAMEAGVPDAGLPHHRRPRGRGRHGQADDRGLRGPPRRFHDLPALQERLREPKRGKYLARDGFWYI